MNPWRRALLLGALLPGGAGAAGGDDDAIRRGRRWQFPRDHGSHGASRTEWWYVTGWTGTEAEPTLGFQLTFFRSRTGLAADLPGRLAPRQLLFAHAAVTDIAAGRHRHAQRLVRWNGVHDDSAHAGASSADGWVWIGDWSLRRSGNGWAARATLDEAGQPTPRGATHALDHLLVETTPPLLQGDQGFSRKGPDERQASHYVTLPQLQVQTAAGTLGRAWLDHEWSDEILAPDAVGWDWVGLNLFNGDALTAFVLRRRDGTALWSGGSLRRSDGQVQVFGPDEVRYTPQREWRSPATGARYPVHTRVDTPAGSWQVRALVDAQEIDARLSTGTVYWEGLSEVRDAAGRRVGLGYLEMTGYAGRLRL